MCLRRVVIACLLLLTWGAGAATVALAAGPTAGEEPAPPPIDVIEVRGRIDAIEAAFITRSLRAAEAGGSQLLVLQLDSPGSVVGERRLGELSRLLAGATLPVAVWVGPSGAEARGGAARLVEAADLAAVATKTRVGGYSGPCPGCPPGAPLLSGRTFGPDQAVSAGAVDAVAPTFGDFIVDLDGRELDGRTLRTARVVQRDTPRREPISQVRFAELGLVERALHATVVPWTAYVLFVLGLLLLVFELYSVGIGLAGLTGAGSLVLGAYGLAALGAQWPGVILLGVAALGYAIDVQAGAPRAWTVIGTVSLVVGTQLLYPDGLSVPLWIQVAVLIGVLLFMVRAMPSVVRARFSTATIGREAMIGERAEATTRFDPEGMVRLRGGLWRARATRASRIDPGTPVEVVALDGLVLEVAPVDEDDEPPTAPSATPPE